MSLRNAVALPSLCVAALLSTASCAGYFGGIVKVYPGPERDRGEVALLIQDAVRNDFKVTKIDEDVILRRNARKGHWERAVTYREDKAGEFSTVVPDKSATLWIYQIAPGSHVVSLEFLPLVVMKGETVQAASVQLRFEAKAGRVYRPVEGKTYGSNYGQSYRATSVFVADITDGTPIRVSQ